MVRKWIAFFVVAMIVAGGFAAATADAKDAKGCDGLGDYRTEMFKVGRDYLKANSEDGIPFSRELLTYSSDDWTNLAENVLEYQRGLNSIDPPDWAQQWHQTQIEGAGLLEQIGRAAAENGALATVAFSDQAEAIQEQRDAALKAVSKICSQFTEFRYDWDALDGDVDGTPVATPTD